MQKKKGISLIVLVITIIVMIILAGVIILSLSNAGIIGKAEEAVDKTNLSEVQHLATLIWSDEYLKQQEDGTIIEGELYNAVETGLIKENIDMDKYYLIVTSTGVSIVSSNGTKTTSAPENWRTNVTQLVDGVPIPKGFVASMATGENKKNTGLVIYEGTAAVTDKNVDEARFIRNQYVWVPVDKDKFEEQFVRKDFKTNTVIENVTTIDYGHWEPNSLTERTEAVLKEVSEQTLDEVQAMYASIKEYGGFYVARYEAGIDTQRTELGEASDLPGIKEGSKVYSVMGKIPYTYIPWAWDYVDGSEANGAIEIARSLYPNDITKNQTGVVSTLIYGAQWDRTVQWFIDSGTITLEFLNSLDFGKEYGNDVTNDITLGELNPGAKYAIETCKDPADYDEVEDDCVGFKVLGEYKDVEYDENGNSVTTRIKSGTGSIKAWALTTGALTTAKINNIYDMAGNFEEWTMEMNERRGHVFRGGVFNSELVFRQAYPVTAGIGTLFEAPYTFRSALYIKK